MVSYVSVAVDEQDHNVPGLDSSLSRGLQADWLAPWPGKTRRAMPQAPPLPGQGHQDQPCMGVKEYCSSAPVQPVGGPVADPSQLHHHL